MKGKSTISKRIALGLLVAAFAAPAAQAADRPDNRAGPLGVAPAASTAVSSVRPDDRAGIRGIGQTSAVIDSSDVVSRYLRNRTNDTSDVISRYVANVLRSSPPQAVRPDDRTGPLGIGQVEFVPASSGNTFDWGDAGIGVAAGLGLALALAGALLLVTHRRPGGRKIGAAAAG